MYGDAGMFDPLKLWEEIKSGQRKPGHMLDFVNKDGTFRTVATFRWQRYNFCIERDCEGEVVQAYLQGKMPAQTSARRRHCIFCRTGRMRVSKSGMGALTSMSVSQSRVPIFV